LSVGKEKTQRVQRRGKGRKQKKEKNNHGEHREHEERKRLRSGSPEYSGKIWLRLGVKSKKSEKANKVTVVFYLVSLWLRG